MPVELRLCGHEVSSEHGKVVYRFELWKTIHDGVSAAREAELIHRFGARFSALKTLHQALSARYPALPKFPSSYVLRNMVSDTANRELRASELLVYLRGALLSDASVWEEEIVRAALGVDSRSAEELMAAIRNKPVPHLQEPARNALADLLSTPRAARDRKSVV